MAFRDIEKGDEITCDYGVRGLTWMAPSPVKLERKKMSDSGSKYNLEAYRKSYFCTVPGCKSDKPQKKLANHIAVPHRSVSAEERHAYLAKAKQVAARRGRTQFPTLAQPTIQSMFTAAEVGPGPSRR